MRLPILLAFGLASFVLGLPDEIPESPEKCASCGIWRSRSSADVGSAQITGTSDGLIDQVKRDGSDDSPDDDDEDADDPFLFQCETGWFCGNGVAGPKCTGHDKRTALPVPQPSAVPAPAPGSIHDIDGDLEDAYNWVQEGVHDAYHHVGDKLDSAVDYIGDKACDHGIGGSECHDRDKRADVLPSQIDDGPGMADQGLSEREIRPGDIIPDAVRTIDTVIDNVLTVLANNPRGQAVKVRHNEAELVNSERGIGPAGISSLIDDAVRSVDTVIDFATTMLAGQSRSSIGGANKKRGTTTRLQTFTLTVIDEEPGERTLNPPTSPVHGVATHTVTLTRSLPNTKGTIDHSTSTNSDVDVKTVKVVNLGSTKAVLLPTTNAEGHPIHVTGSNSASSHPFAAVSTHTVWYTFTSSSQSVVMHTVTKTWPTAMSSVTHVPQYTKTVTVPDSSFFTGGALPTITKTIYRTVTCGSSAFDPNERISTVAVVNGMPLTITAPSGSYGPNHDTVIIVAPTPQAALHPLQYNHDLLEDLLQFNLDAYRLGRDYGHIMSYNAATLRERYPDMDWPGIAQTAGVLRTHYSALDWDESVRRAVCWSLRQSQELQVLERGLFGGKGKDKGTTTPAANATTTVANIGGTLVDISQIAQTIDGTRVITADPRTPFNLHWAAQQTPMAKPPACHKGKDSHYNKTECRIQKCLLKHYKPMNITTVFPAILEELSWPFTSSIDYFTHVTSLTGAHWGVTESHGTYYPLKTTAMPGPHGSPTVTVVRETPASLKHHRRSWRHPLRHHHDAKDAPKCWSLGTCCERCAKDVNGGLFKKLFSHIPWWLLFLPLALLPGLLALLCCCCWGIRKHRRNKKLDPDASIVAIIPGVQRRKTNVVVPVDPNTQVIETVTTSGAPAIVAIPTPTNEKSGTPGNTATTTAVETPSGDGRGTMSRRAEEGRGRVQFAADPTQPSTTTPTTTGTGTEAAAPQEGTGESGAPIVTTTEQSNKPVPVSDEPSKPVQRTSTMPAGSPTTTTEKTETVSGDLPKPVQRTFTTPAGQPVTVVETHEETAPGKVDGAAESRRTGSEVAGMGSMRGRKANRQAGSRDLLNLGF